MTLILARIAYALLRIAAAIGTPRRTAALAKPRHETWRRTGLPTKVQTFLEEL